MVKAFIRNPPLWVSFVLFVVLCGVVFFLKESLLAYQSLNQNVEQLLGERAQSIAEMAAAVVNPEAHQNVVRAFLEEKPQIKKSEDFVKIQRILRRIQLIHKLEHEISTLVWMRTSPPNTLARILSGNRKVRIGKSFIVKPEAFNVFESKKPVRTALYQTEDGTWVSGFAPVKDKANNVIAVVAVQLRADQHLSAKSRKILAKAGTSSAAVIILLVGLAFWFANRMRRAWADRSHLSMSKFPSAKEIEEKELEKLRLQSELDSAKKALTEQQTLVQSKEDEMEAIQKLHQNIVDCFSEACLVFRKDGSLISVVSQNSETLFGEKCAEKPIWDLLGGDISQTRNVIKRMFEPKANFEEVARSLPNTLTNPQGETIELAYYPFRNKVDQLTGVVVIGAKPESQVGASAESGLSRQRLLRFVSTLSPRSSAPEIQEQFLNEFMSEPVGRYTAPLVEHAEKVARKLNKPVPTLRLTGEDLRVVPEAYLPLFPALKNAIGFAISFGIESTVRRSERGKPPSGTLTLTFELIRESFRPAWLFITLTDDGSGISVSSLRKNLRTHGTQYDNLSDFAVLQKVLDPRLGLGRTGEAELHSLQTFAAQLNGQVEVQSTAGLGTHITIMLPYQQALLALGNQSIAPLREVA